MHHRFTAVSLALVVLTACAKHSPPSGVNKTARRAPPLPGSFPDLLEVAAAEPKPVHVLSGARFWRARFSRDGRRLAALEMTPKGDSFEAIAVATFDPVTGERLQSWPLPSPLLPHKRPTLAIDGNTLAMALDGVLYVSHDDDPLTRYPDLSLNLGEVALSVYGSNVLLHQQLETPIWTDGTTHTALSLCDPFGQTLYAAGAVVCLLAEEDDVIARIDATSGEVLSQREVFSRPWAVAYDDVSVAFGGYGSEVEVRNLSTDTTASFSMPYQRSTTPRFFLGAGQEGHWLLLYEDYTFFYPLFVSPQGSTYGAARIHPLLDAAVFDTRGIVVAGPGLEHVNLDGFALIDGIGTQPGGQLTFGEDELWTLAERGLGLVAQRWSVADGALLGMAQHDQSGDLAIVGAIDPDKADDVLSSESFPTPAFEVPSGIRNAESAIAVGEIGAIVPSNMTGAYRTFWSDGDAVQEGARLAVQEWMSGDLRDAQIDPATQQVVLSFDDWVGWWPLDSLRSPRPPLARSTSSALPSSGIHTLFGGRETFADRPRDASRELTESGWLPESLAGWLPSMMPDARVEEAWRQVEGSVIHERTLFWWAGQGPVAVPVGFKPSSPPSLCGSNDDVEMEGFFEARNGETLCIQRWTDSHRTAVVTHSTPVGDANDRWAAGLYDVLQAHPDTETLVDIVEALETCVRGVEIRHHMTGGAVWLTLKGECSRLERARLHPWCEANGLSVDAKGGCLGDWGYTEVYTDHFSNGEMWLNFKL